MSHSFIVACLFCSCWPWVLQWTLFSCQEKYGDSIMAKFACLRYSPNHTWFPPQLVPGLPKGYCYRSLLFRTSIDSFQSWLQKFCIDLHLRRIMGFPINFWYSVKRVAKHLVDHSPSHYPNKQFNFGLGLWQLSFSLNSRCYSQMLTCVINSVNSGHLS